MKPLRISVIVRARDEAPAIGRCLQILAGQTLGPGSELEVIVIDNESADATAAIARAHGARVLSLPRAEFSFGTALNLGARAATGSLHVALSAHAFPRDPGWLGRLTAVFADPLVACACGERFRPDGVALTAPARVDAGLARAHPEWGYSNAAGAYRASLWRERPFREDLPACEDKEWAAYWLGRGYVCLLDPALSVEHDHTHDPVRDIYRRARREAVALSMIRPAPGVPVIRPAPEVPVIRPAPEVPGGRGPASARAPGLRGLAREWWSDTRFYDSPWRARLSHRRAARLLGAFAGARSRPSQSRRQATPRQRVGSN